MVALIVDGLFVGLWIVFAFFIVTQILAPLARGTKFFPLFRKNIREAEHSVIETLEKEYETQLLTRAEELRNEAEEVRNRRNAKMVIDVKGVVEKLG